MNELKCLYFIIHNNNNKPICLYRIDQHEKLRILAGAMPNKDSAYTKTLIADNTSSYLISEALATINQADKRQQTNRKKGNRLGPKDLETIKQSLLIEVPYPVLERRYGVSKRTLQRIKSTI